jgi:PKD repeat protein
MNHTLRVLALALLMTPAMAVMAQPTPPYPIAIAGIVQGCMPNSQVTIESMPGTQPTWNYTINLENCGFDTVAWMQSPGGGFVITVPCNGTLLTAVGQYQVDTSGADSIMVVLNCSGNTPDCLDVPGGGALPGTACTTFLGIAGTWSADCECIPNASSCQACFTVSSNQPWTINLNNCTVLGTPPFEYLWLFSDGSTSAQSSPVWTLTQAGNYYACLTIVDSEGCTSSTCDSLSIDANGALVANPIVWDCLQITNGPNMPGTPCTTPAGGEGTWSSLCECLPNTPTTCQAGFWVVQAYTVGDSVNNPGGGVEPIPNEVWVWNLSSGGDGNYQFFWSFGDGSSSTEAYPTHVYATGGPYQLCLTMTDGSGCTSTYCDDVSVDEDGLYTGLIVDGRPGLLRSSFTISVRSEQPTAIAERDLVENVALWPNPVEDVIGLSFNSLNNASLSLTIFDLNGRVVRSTNTVVNTGQNDQRIHVADLEAGMYLLQITNGAQRSSRRFVKR